MFPTHLDAFERLTLVRDRTAEDLAHRALVRDARSDHQVPAHRPGVTHRVRVRLGDALVATGTAIAGSADDRGTADALSRPA